MEPRFGQSPITHHGDRRHSQRFGRLFNAQPSKIPQFSDPAFTLIERRQNSQSIIQSNQVFRSLIRHGQPLIKRHSQLSTTAFCVVPLASIVNQNHPHHLGCHGEEVSAVPPAHLSFIDQLQIRFVYQVRGLQSMTGAFVPESAPGEAAQLLIDQRRQSVERGSLSVAPGNK